jgi:hypothetical protein
MAENSTTEQEELTLEAHLQFAVRIIEADVHLRELVKHFLNMTNAFPPNSVFDVNPVQNAYNQGYQSAGFAFAQILTSVEPRLVPTLMIEELTDE